LKVKDGRKGHTSKYSIDSVNVAQSRILVLEVASVMGTTAKKQMNQKNKRMEGLLFTNANLGFAGIFADLQEGNTTMLIQPGREAMTINQEMQEKSS